MVLLSKQAKYIWEKVQAGSYTENPAPKELRVGLIWVIGFLCSPPVRPVLNDMNSLYLPLSLPLPHVLPTLGMGGEVTRLLQVFEGRHMLR